MTSPQASQGLRRSGRAYHELAVAGQGTGADPGADLASLPLIGAAIRRRARLCCATAMLGMVAGAGLYLVAPPPYQASTSVLLTQNPTVNPVNTAQTDVALALTRSVAGPVLRRLGLHESVAAFIASYSVVPVTDRVLVFTANAPSGPDAVRRSAALAAQFLSFRADELLTQQQLVTRALTPQVQRARQRLASLTASIASISAQRATPRQASQLARLRDERYKAITALGTLTLSEAGSQATTHSMIAGSGVLDAAALLPMSRRLPVIYAADGLLIGLVGGIAFVAISALTTDRPRRREDVALALGAPVRLSVRRPLGRWPRRLAAAIRWPRRAAAGRTRDVSVIVGYLRGAVGRTTARGTAAMAVVAVGSPRVAAIAVRSLAVSLARDGRRVMVADLTPRAPAAGLLGVTYPGVRVVTADGVRVTVAVPDSAYVAPSGPVPVGWVGRRPQASQLLVDAHDAADVLLTLASPDPALGAEHLASDPWRGAGAGPAPAAGRPARCGRCPLSSPTVAVGLARAILALRSATAQERWVRRRLTMAWAFLLLDTLTFYPKTWSGQPLALPIPSVAGKLITQGALPVALLLALTLNRRLAIRPNVFLCLVSLLALEATMSGAQAQHIGTIYRTFRLIAFVATLWLLSPW